uniref:Calpain 10 n=1 Tax=Cebus imitator TaxID=2715852 RepID=A0A2K5SDE9_CEBIM
MRAGCGLFRDAAFPAADSSLFCDLSTPLAQFREDITWRRPQEICATPRLFPDDPREGQVKQGLLGDCWFLCACAALQKSRHLLNQVGAPSSLFASRLGFPGLPVSQPVQLLVSCDASPGSGESFGFWQACFIRRAHISAGGSWCLVVSFCEAGSHR